MAIYVEINPREREATLRSAHSLCAGESAEIVLSGIPDADTATLSLRLYRDRSEAEFVAAARRPGDADPPQEGFAAVQGRAALRRAVLDLCSESVASWASDVFERSESESDGPEGAPRPPETAWMVVADVSRVWAACEVPFLLRPMSPESADVALTLPSLVERAREAAESAERSASAASEAAGSASAAADRAEAATSGKADLVDGKVPASQLPPYVLEVAELPASGESGKLYVVTRTNAVYRWDRSSFVEVSPSRDWSGELASKRGKTDFSVGDGWLLVKPDGTQAWLEKPDPQRDEWTGDGFTLAYETTEAYWGLAKMGESDWVVDASDDSPPDANKLEFTGSDDTSVYRLVRGSRLALDTEIPPAQVNADWNAESGKAQILNKPAIPTVPTPVAPSTAASAQGKPADAKATGVFILSGLEFDPEDSEYEVGQIVLYEGKLYRCVNPHSGPWNSRNFRETSIGAVLNYLTLFKYTEPDGGIPASDLSQAVQTALAAVPGKADAADLRYRIAEAGYATTGARLPDNVAYVIANETTYQASALTLDGSSTYMLFGNGNVLGVEWRRDTGTPIGNPFDVVFYDSGDTSFSAVPDLIVPRALADRTVNLITASAETSIDIELPAVQAGHSRDFCLAVTCGSTAPTLNAPTSGVTLVNAKGEPPDLSLSADATTVLRFTEVKEADAEADPLEPAVFCVTGGANGGGSLDLSVLADEFSEESTYEEGDIVQYQGELYVCEFGIETPGEWSDSDWSSASPVIPVLLSMIRGKADSSDLDSKAESTALAPAWISGHAYFKGDHVSYEGLLYECLSTVAGSTNPSADTTHWKLTDLAAPDATLDILSDGRLRVVAADGTPMWTQGYALASESAVALSCEKINKYAFAATTATAFSDSSTYAVGDRVTYGGKVYKCSTAVETAGAWTGATNWDEDPDTQAFALPNAPSGIVGDFVLDVDNTANEVPVMVAISGTLGTDYDLIVEKGRSSVDVLTIEGGALAELYFTMTAFGTAAKPAWRVVRLNVERQEVGS